ncbi:SMC-Scp complex subunit ScpB [Allorhodopirellula solitaria]|nr:SMC-Scp complex subunit ScpB [Allorhodopirellula solitaria]
MNPYSAPWQRVTSLGGRVTAATAFPPLTAPRRRGPANVPHTDHSPGSDGQRAFQRDAEDRLAEPTEPHKPTEEEAGGAEAGPDTLDASVARSRVEALLLIAKSPLNYRKIASLAGLEDATQARTLVAELNELYDSLGRAFRIEQLAGGCRMMTRSFVAPWLRRLGVLAPAIRLSWPMMETLAVVAYRQDVTRADVESVRGVACGEILRQLMQLDLVRISGRSEDLGRPYLYGTTKRFLKICGLPTINALPAIDSQRFCDDVSGNLIATENDGDSELSPAIEPVDETASQVPKESDVSLAVTDALATDSVLSHFATGVADAATESFDDVTASASSDAAPAAVIEDEEDDLYEHGLDVDDDEDFVDDDEDDWDDDEDEDADEDDDLDDDDDEDIDEDDSWEEVDDDDADEDWDDEDDSDEEDDDDDWDDDDDD